MNNPVYQIDLGLINEPETYNIILSKEMYSDIAERFKVPQVHEISFDAEVKPQNDLWILSGSVYATLQLQCVQTEELFDATFNVPFNVLLSNYEIDDDFVDVELLETSKVDIGEIAIQYLALEVPFNPLHPTIEAQASSQPTLLFEQETPEWKKALERLKSQK